MPASRNCSPRVVLPVPGLPSIRYRCPPGSPPCRISSKPGTPVFRRVLELLFNEDRAAFLAETVEVFIIASGSLLPFLFDIRFYRPPLDSQLRLMFARDLFF